MRPPLSAIEPRKLSVSTGMRGEEASASARGTDAGAAVCAPGTCGETDGVVFGVAAGV